MINVVSAGYTYLSRWGQGNNKFSGQLTSHDFLSLTNVCEEDKTSTDTQVAEKDKRERVWSMITGFKFQYFLFFLVSISWASQCKKNKTKHKNILKYHSHFVFLYFNFLSDQLPLIPPLNASSCHDNRKAQHVKEQKSAETIFPPPQGRKHYYSPSSCSQLKLTVFCLFMTVFPLFCM